MIGFVLLFFAEDVDLHFIHYLLAQYILAGKIGKLNAHFLLAEVLKPKSALSDTSFVAATDLVIRRGGCCWLDSLRPESESDSDVNSKFFFFTVFFAFRFRNLQIF